MTESIFRCTLRTDSKYERNGYYMSASDKKKLRKEQNAEKMTQRQQKERAEAKKLKAYTVSFVCAMIAIVVVLAVVFTIKWYNTSGIQEKNTLAVVIGDYEMNSVEMSYYYNDAINNFYSEVYSSVYSEEYFTSLGLDLSQPLNEQENPNTGDTWANYFIDGALETAQSDFAMYNKAMEAGFKLSEEEQAEFDSEIKVLKTNAELYGGADVYLRQIYGYGADLESYTKYLERNHIATAFYNAYYEDLSYTNDELRAYEEDKYNTYTSYTYAYAYLSYRDFLEGGTQNESGTTEYSDEENNAAREKMLAAAKTLSAATSVDELKEMIETVEVNETSSLAVNEQTNAMYISVSSQNEDLANWMSDENREAGDVGMIEVTVNVDTEAEESETVTNGCYVVIYLSHDDNTKPMSNVRHILIEPEGGYIDDTTGETVYTEAEQAITLQEAEKILDSWKAGEATEESFIALVKEYSADTASVEDGGLYEDINPHSEYMEAFLNWAVDPARKAGDTGIVETSYGQHIMYYVGDSEQTYRDYLISVDMANEEIEEFYQTAVDATTVVKKDMSKLNLSMVLSG